MAAGAWVFTDKAKQDILDGTQNIDTDSYKMALFLSTSDIGILSTTYALVTNEVGNGLGYATGGIALASFSVTGTSTKTIDSVTDAVWTASGGSIVARFAVIYEVAGDVLCYCLLDSTPANVTATDGNTLTVAFHASGLATLTSA